MIQDSYIAYNSVLKTENGTCGGVSVNSGNLTIDKSVIKNNSAYSLGALMIGTGNLNIHKSQVVNNRSTSLEIVSGGTMLIQKGTANIVKSKVSNNVTQGMYSGGLVSIIGNVNVSYSEFSANRCNGPGGAIACNFSSHLRIVNTFIKNNVAAAFGGAVVNFSLAKSTKIINTKIKNNVLTDAMNMHDVFKAFIETAKEETNTSTSKTKTSIEDIKNMLGLIALSMKLEEKLIDNDKFFDFLTQFNGIAGTIASFSNVDILKSSIVNNKLIGNFTQGGAVYSLGRRNRSEKSIFKNNIAFGNRARGHAICTNFKWDIIDSLFERNGINEAKPSRKALGTIYVSNDKTSIKNSAFINNYAEKGAGIYINEGAQVYFADSVVVENTASSEGGGIYVEEEGFVNNNSVIKNNSPDDVSTS